MLSNEIGYMDSYRIFRYGGGGGGIMSSRKKQQQFIYIIWSSHDRETVKQISDENLTVLVRRRLRDHF